MPPSQSSNTLSEVQVLKKFSIAELVGGALLIIAMTAHAYATTERISVLENTTELNQEQLDRMERNIEYLVKREIERSDARPK